MANRDFTKGNACRSTYAILVICIRCIYYTYMGPKFDPDKDAANIIKHGLSLVEGEGVLNDPARSDSGRWIL